MKKALFVSLFFVGMSTVSVFGFNQTHTHSLRHGGMEITEAGTRCTFCNGTGFQGNFNCNHCKGSGRNGSY